MRAIPAFVVVAFLSFASNARATAGDLMIVTDTGHVLWVDLVGLNFEDGSIATNVTDTTRTQSLYGPDARLGFHAAFPFPDGTTLTWARNYDTGLNNTIALGELTLHDIRGAPTSTIRADIPHRWNSFLSGLLVDNNAMFVPSDRKSTRLNSSH